jgi:aminoglycoside 6'-N-acetyltransferase I
MGSRNTRHIIHTTIRPAVPDDATGWESLRAQLWPDVDSACDIAQYFAANPEKRDQLFLAQRPKGFICGFIELSIRRDWVEGSTSSSVAYVESWFVHPDHRKKGIGKALLVGAENWAREAGFTEMGSTTLIENEDSIAAHLSCGYTEVERAVHFIKSLEMQEAGASNG